MAKVEIPERKAEQSKPATPPASAAAPRKRRWLLKFLLLSAAAILILPTGLSIFGQVPIILQKLHPKLADAVEFRTISLHWWAPVEIAGLIVRDLGASETSADAKLSDSGHLDSLPGDSLNSDGRRPLISIPLVTTAEPLWRIALQLGRGTSVVLNNPHLHLVVDEHGSNLQQTITSIFGSDEESNTSTFPIRLVVRNGMVSVRSELQPEPSAITDINGTFATPTVATALPEINLAARFQSSAEMSSQKSTAVSGDRGTQRSSSSRIAANLDELVSDFSVIPLQSFSDGSDALAANSTGTESASASMLIQLTPASSSSARQSIRLATRGLDLRMLQPILSCLNAGILCDGIAACDVEAELAGHSLQDGIVARVLFAGQQVRFRQTGWAAGEWLHLGDTSISGAVAVAHDGILLNQLSLQSDILEASGSGEFRAAATPESVQTSNTDSGTAAAAENPSRRVPTSKSDNIALIQGRLNLAGVATMLPQTIGLRDDVVINSGHLNFSLKAELAGTDSSDSGESSMVARWQAVIQNERIEAIRAGQPLNVESVFRLDALGPLRAGTAEIAQARLSADFGKIDLIPRTDGYQLTGILQPAAVWQQLQQFVQIPQPGIRGDLRFDTFVQFRSGVTRLTELKLASSEIRVSSGMLQIHHHNPLPTMLEGDLHAEGSGAAMRTLMLPWHDASWLAPHSGVIVDLTASMQQPLRLTATIQPGRLAAAASGTIRSVGQSSPGTTSPVSSRLHTASAVATSGFQIDQATVDLNLKTTSGSGIYEIQNGNVQLPGIASAVSGTIASIGSDMELNLTADTQYDLQVLCDRMLATDSWIRLNGRGRDTFRITGSPSLLQSSAGTQSNTGRKDVGTQDSLPTTISPLRATGGIAWDSGTLWGLRMSSASVKAVVENGLFRTEPIQCQLNTGELHLMPQFDLVRQRLQLATGSRVQNIELTPELCRQWMSYLTPLMADATDVNGRISARVERFDYDLNVPQNSDAAAVVTIHNAQASPGTLLMPLLDAINLIRRVGNADRSSVVRSITLPAQDVALQLRQGFVVHQGLMIELAGYRAKSSGAVGLNRQLQLTLDIPLEKAAGSNEFRNVRIPIGGTIDRPLPDTSALLQGLGTQAIEQKLNNQLDRQLNKLLDKL